MILPVENRGHSIVEFGGIPFGLGQPLIEAGLLTTLDLAVNLIHTYHVRG